MATLIIGDPPPELRELLERRRRAGADRLDEVWEGVRYLLPALSIEHAHMATQVAMILDPLAHAAGLMPAGRFTLGESEYDYRVPDGGLFLPGASGVWQFTASMVVEIMSPDDESLQKLPFYAAHNVDEVLLVDPTTETVTWLALRDGDYQPVEHSGLIALGPAELVSRLDWP